MRFIQGNFCYLKTYLNQSGISQVHGIIFDLGVSSFQLDNGERGFSYHQAAPLDMRMDPQSPLSAWEIVNRYSELELTRIIRDFGEEKWARRIARFIVERRSRQPIDTTTELVDVIKAAMPPQPGVPGRTSSPNFPGLKDCSQRRTGHLTRGSQSGH